MVAPTVLFLVAIFAYPLISTALTSLQKVKLQNPGKSTFIGIDNYTEFLGDPAFWQAVGRTAYFTVVSVGVELALGLAIAEFGVGYGLVVLAALANVAGLVVAGLLAWSAGRTRRASHPDARL